jgi:PRTRC genetic system protein A
VRYDDAVVDCERLALDLHSHGIHHAYFSGTDDASDLARPGPHLSLVVGRCTSVEEARMAVRLCCAPFLIPVPLVLLKTGLWEPR